MKYCCDFFQWMIESKDNKGFSIEVTFDKESLPKFDLICKSVKKGDEAFVKSERVLSLSSSIGIQFCPSCGKRLLSYYVGKLKAPT